MLTRIMRALAPIFLLSLQLLGVQIPILADDWPEWQGSQRDNISQETGLKKTWPEEGPQLVWLYQNAGKGYSGPAIADRRLFTMGTRDDKEQLICLEAATGKEVWLAAMGDILDNGWGDGPRGTPTVDGPYVYALSGTGELVCAKVENGEVVWRANMEDFGGSIPNWGYSESVLIDGDRVVCSPGGPDGAILALNKLTGEVIWQSEDIDDKSHYSSVIPVDFSGDRQYVQLFPDRLVGVAASDGLLLWESEWSGRVAVVPTPIHDRGRIYITSGYGVGCKLVSLTDDEPKEVYANKHMVNHHGGVVLLNGHLYGYSDGGGWTCQNLETGEVVWAEREALGKGAISCADGMLYCLSEGEGEVVLVPATTEGWSEKGRFKLDPQTKIRKPEGRIWTHPVISHGRLYLRDQDLIYCYDIKK